MPMPTNSRSKGRIFLAHRNREHRTQNRQHMMSKYNLDVMDEVTRDTIPENGRK